MKMQRMATALAAGTAAAVLLPACSASFEVGGSTLDTAEVEAEVADQLEALVGERPASIDCPDDITAEEGATHRCTLTTDDGSTIGLTLTMTDDEGSFDIEVDDEPQE